MPPATSLAPKQHIYNPPLPPLTSSPTSLSKNLSNLTPIDIFPDNPPHVKHMKFRFLHCISCGFKIIQSKEDLEMAHNNCFVVLQVLIRLPDDSPISFHNIKPILFGLSNTVPASVLRDFCNYLSSITPLHWTFQPTIDDLDLFGRDAYQFYPISASKPHVLFPFLHIKYWPTWLPRRYNKLPLTFPPSPPVYSIQTSLPTISQKHSTLQTTTCLAYQDLMTSRHGTSPPTPTYRTLSRTSTTTHLQHRLHTYNGPYIPNPHTHRTNPMEIHHPIHSSTNSYMP